MNNKFHQSKIYIIRSKKTDRVYIGATCNSLCRRMTGHRDKYHKWRICPLEKYYTSYELFNQNDEYIELLEAYKCNTQQELNKREAYWIRLFGSLVVNKQIPGRTRSEYEADRKRKILNLKALQIEKTATLND